MEKPFQWITALLAALPTVLAHESIGGGIVNGLLHPVFGPDHLLAMVAVGILSMQIGGKAIWRVPATFVGVMLLGGVLAMIGIPFLAVEIGIALSVLALGVALAFQKKLPTFWSMIFVGFFAVFHGHAHGTEMPNLAQPVLYAIGFVLATALLHIAGVLIGYFSKRVMNGEIVLRYVGAGIAGIGFAILFGL